MAYKAPERTGNSRVPPLSAVRAFEAAARLGSFTRAATELHMTQAAVSYQIRQLEQRLGLFQLAHPGIAVRLETGVALADLVQGESDIGIRLGNGDWPELQADFLLPSLFTPLCSPALRERLRTLADLLALPRFGRERWWREWFAAAGLADADLTAQPGVELEIEQYAVTAAIAGHGVAISSPLLFEADLAVGRLLQPFDRVVRDQRDYWLAYPAVRRNSVKIRAFRAWALEQATNSLDTQSHRLPCRAGTQAPRDSAHS